MTKTTSKVNIEDLTILYSELTGSYYIANPNNTSVKKDVTKEVEALINKAFVYEMNIISNLTCECDCYEDNDEEEDDK